MEKDLNKYIDKLIQVMEQIKQNNKDIIILTGNNGSGKSLIRRQLSSYLSKDGEEITVKSVSMDTRTQQNHNFGALRSLGMDDPDMPTSLNTLRLIKGVISAINKENKTKSYLILDEIEVGCSEETTLALTLELNEIFNEIKDKNIGVLIITHSRLVVNNIKNDMFINLEGKTKEEWINREITPTDLNQLRENELFQVIKKRLRKKED